MSHNPLLKIFKGPEAIDKVLQPVHNISFLLFFLATLSFQAVMTELLGPLKDLLACFLITFPFTMGLTFLFVIIINLDWRKVTGTSVIVTIALLTLFFWMLIFISHKLNLEKKGHDIRERRISEQLASLQKDLQEERGIVEPVTIDSAHTVVEPPGSTLSKPDVRFNADSILNDRLINGDGTINDSVVQPRSNYNARLELRVRNDSNPLLDSLQTTDDQLKEMLKLSEKHPEIQRNLKHQADEMGKMKIDINPPDPWYMKIATIGPFIATLVYFETVMGSGGFLSAIALAAFFTWYIQRFGGWLGRVRRRN